MTARLLIACWTLCLCTAALAADLRTGPLALSIDDATGRITAAALAGRDVAVPAAVGASGFSIADGPTADLKPLVCRVEKAGQGWLWQGQTDGLALSCTAAPLAGGLELTGAVCDPRGDAGADHAVTVRFALPVNLAGWRFDNGIERAKTIRANTERSNAKIQRWGRGPFDLWPVNAVAGNDASIGFATRIDLPQFTRVIAASDGLRIEFDFALVSFVKKLPRRSGVHVFAGSASRRLGREELLGQLLCGLPRTLQATHRLGRRLVRMAGHPPHRPAGRGLRPSLP